MGAVDPNKFNMETMSNERISEQRTNRLAQMNAQNSQRPFNMFNVPYDLLELDKEKSKPCYFDNKN